MKLPELRKAVTCMSDDQLLSLAELYESLLNPENEGGYVQRLEIVEKAMSQDRTPDLKLSKRANYWKGL